MNRRVCSLLLLILAACTSAHPARAPSTQPTPTGQGGPVSSPPASSAGAPQIWFAPDPSAGSVDFMDLFDQTSPWVAAARHVHTFQLDGRWVNTATDEQLRQAVVDLNRRGITIALQDGPLVPTSTCGQGLEGFGGPVAASREFNRIRAAGGTVASIALDEPFYYGHLYGGPGACHWPLQRIGRDVRRYLRGARGDFPNVVVGDVEALAGGAEVRGYESWIREYRSVAGSELPFLHLRVDFDRPNWPAEVKRLEAFTRSLGTDFGIIDTGQGGTDQEWIARAEERLVTYEVKAGGHPDDVVFTSSGGLPDHLLPETSPGAFTYLIDRVFRTPTRLLVEQAPSPFFNAFRVIGVLTDAAGTPITRTPVELTGSPISGRGISADYSLRGTVPRGALRAVVGLRINTECGCSGRGDLQLYDGSYTEQDHEANRVPNGDFHEKLSRWSRWGNGSVRPERSDGAYILQVTATPAQVAGVDSSSFLVAAGAHFSVSFSALVPPASSGSGYFAVVFLNQRGEVARETIPIGPAILPLGTPTMAEDGTFHFTLRFPSSGGLSIDAWYPGDDRHWPAFGRVRIAFSGG